MIGRKVSDDENVICTANSWLEDQEQQFFYSGIRTLKKPWPSAFLLQENMSKSDKIWCVYLVVNCVSLRTFWTPLVLCAPVKLRMTTTVVMITTPLCGSDMSVVVVWLGTARSEVVCSASYWPWSISFDVRIKRTCSTPLNSSDSLVRSLSSTR